MKIALCHVDVSCGPQERNLRLLARAVDLAARQGAEWVVTPETAVQGYYFYKINASACIPQQPAPELDELRELCRRYKLYLFLGCGEYDSARQKSYNSCIIFGADGEVCGRQRKIFNTGGAEGWATAGDSMEVIYCGAIKAGVLVCADAWFEKNPAALQRQGAEILVDIAAWPPTEICGDPLPSWVEVSRATGLPFIVCNQTGRAKWMDMTVGQSVVITDGELQLAYSGAPAVLLFEYDFAQRRLMSEAFTVLRV